MPAVDPLSASARPFIPHEFAALDRVGRGGTLQRIDQNATDTLSLPSDPQLKQRVYKDSLPPPAAHSSPYWHWRTSSSTSINDLEQIHLHASPVPSAVQVGSDQWMDDEVSRCLVMAKADLDIKGKGLTSLSTKIADLNKVVTLPVSRSPFSSAHDHRTSPLSPRSSVHSPIPPSNETLSPGSGPYSANSRPFVRHMSAPVSAQAFRQLDGPRTSNDHQPSRLRTVLLDSPTLTETSEEGSQSAVSQHPVLAGPSLPPNFGRTLSPAAPSRSFGRSKTGVGIRHFTGEQAAREVTVNAAQNCLTSLPSALFEISNLTSLTLRSNRLARLPAAIGELHSLRELNIGNNRITELPSTILLLTNLVNFHAHPNPWLTPVETVAANGRRLGPLNTRCRGSVSRLADTCINFLITPSTSTDPPPFLRIPWQADCPGEAHPLLDVDALHSRIPHAKPEDLARILQCVRSASGAAERSRRSGRRTSTTSTCEDGQFPHTHAPSAPDDAADNAYYYPCPSPRHRLVTDYDTPRQPDRRLFLHSAEERLEWTTVLGQSDLPVRHRGCSPGCLAFLEDDHEDDELWGLSSDED